MTVGGHVREGQIDSEIIKKWESECEKGTFFFFFVPMHVSIKIKINK